VKLVVAEPGSDALLAFLADRPVRVSCSLARVEVVRAVHAQGPAAVARAGQMLRRIQLLRLDDELLDDAAGIDPRVLRSLDAIHLAAARRLGDRVREVITCDRRMLDAAELLGLTAVAPGGKRPT
jgi:predicted nucleic acid-binding protein